MNVKVAYVYSRLSDSGYLCGRPFPWLQAHCDSSGYTTSRLGIVVEDGFRLVYCKKCTLNYAEVDLHFIKKSTAILLAARALLHAKETSRFKVDCFKSS